MIYLDYNATTPVDKQVLQEMLPYFSHEFGNPSSNHTYGISASRAVDKARLQVAGLLGCQSEEIIFTSCGTESNNLAISGSLLANKGQNSHVITSAIEHPAVLETVEYLRENGTELTIIPVDQFGSVQVNDVEAAIRPNTKLISIMHANNEVGTIQPIHRIAQIAHRHKVLFHTDAAQSIGKIPVDVDVLGVDLLSIAGHKLYAPKGVGALFIRSGVRLQKFTHGASQENNLRPGTENVPLIVGLGAACDLITNNLESYQNTMKRIRDFFELEMLSRFKDIRINASGADRLPNTSSISFKGFPAHTLLSKISGVAASAGAACHSNRTTVSHVLREMKAPDAYALGTIRFSMGRHTTREEIIKAVEAIEWAVRDLKRD